MKLLTISGLYFLFIFSLLSCGNSQTDTAEDGLKKDPGSYHRVSVNECIKRILYIENQIDVNDYDSLSTHYFHELRDYVDPDAIGMKRLLDSLNKLVQKARDNNEDPSVLYHLTDSIKAELSPYRKYVIGYAFVHTYLNGTDTTSAIFVMDTMCGFGEMTIVKDKIIGDPIEDDKYASKIKSGKFN